LKFPSQWRTVAQRWGVYTRDFAVAEWTKMAVGAGFGVIGAILKQLLAGDQAFRTTFSTAWTKWLNRPWYRGIDSYIPLLAILAGIVGIALLVRILPFLSRVLKSWIFGIVSGLVFWWSVSFFVFFSRDSLFLFEQLRCSLCASIFFTLVSLSLRIGALERSTHIPKPVSFAIPKRNPNAASPDDKLLRLDADCPIREWDQDVLERAALVESLAITVLVSKAPVIAIQGPFGDGKSSVLHLLKRTLKPHAIVVPFSTWLPGSEQTLAIDLFSDIATECKKHYYLPQLRRRLLTYAKTLGGAISFLKSASDLLPSISQKDEIEEMGNVLNLLPRRIVVLLDEMDRLQKEELQVVLKILRGVPSFPNLSFVCAFAQKEVERILFDKKNEDSAEYFEKFFPVSFALPKQDAALLSRVLQSRLVAVFDDLKWFETAEEKKQFQDKLQETWDDTLRPLCTNLRKVALIVNDVTVAARRLVRDVNALDLVVIEILRRFFPTIYDLVWRNQSQFTESNLSWKTAFRSEDTLKRERTAFFDSLKSKLEETGQAKEVTDLLSRLFPAYATYVGGGFKLSLRRRTEDLGEGEKEKRIFHPDFFTNYFRYQVPEAMFGATELEAFINGMNAISSVQDCVKYFSDFFMAFPKQSPRREDFLRRIALSVGRFKDTQAEALAYGAAKHARDFVYDSIMFMVAEAGRAIVLVFEVAQRFSRSSKVQQILERSIADSTDDTFALRILTLSTETERNKILVDVSHVNPDALKRVFAERMERRYGPQVDISQVKITEGDRTAFVIWAQSSDKARSLEIDFWRRFIDNSRKRLAQAADFIFPFRRFLWETDPTPHVDLLFPTAEFKTLLEKLPSEEQLEASETEALDGLRKLISGEFKSGVPRDW
jgi:hypothetical protein